jgi:DNA polymerase-3 subunit delta
MSYRNFIDEIKKGLPSPNYIFISSDAFLHTEAVSAVKDLVPSEERDFNFHVFDLMTSGNGSFSFEQILDVLNTIPFFTGKQTVVIENFQKALKKDLDKMEKYLLDPSSSSLLVMLYSGTIKKTFKDKLRGVKQIALDMRESEMPVWLKARAASRGLSLTTSAAEHLLGTIGPDLGMLSSEIEKCVLIGGKTVDKKDIIEIVEGKRKYNAFDLVKAINAKNTESVFKIYCVLKETEEPYSLLGALNWQFSQLLSETNTPEEKEYLYDAFDVLSKADLHIKSSGSFYPVELLLIKLLRLSRKRQVSSAL